MRILYHATDRKRTTTLSTSARKASARAGTMNSWNARIEQYLLEHAGGKIVGERETVH